jgi:phospholipid/cholesterol/gamma-HCH transport system permease protein
MPFVQLIEALGRYCHFLIRCLVALPRTLIKPSEVIRPFYDVYALALPLASVAGIALGAVIWMHLHGVLARLGPGYSGLLPEYLALAVVLEFAPLGAGLIVAGRSGASMSAELASMRITEQLDALEVLGQSTMKSMVAPRIAASMLALPLLTVILAILAIAGGFLGESIGGTMSWREFASATLLDLRIKDVSLATLKTVVFGFFIAATACYVGVHATGGTEGVGRAATRGVVWSIFLVVVSDVVLVRLIQVID